MAHAESASPKAEPSPLARLLSIALVVYALLHVYTSAFGNFEPLIQRSLFLGVGVGLIFLEYAARRCQRVRAIGCKPAQHTTAEGRS